jgi:hypothetical protein
VTPWIAVDPGARSTGVTARFGRLLLGWRVIDRHVVEPGVDRPGVATMEAVVAAVAELAEPHGGVTRVQVAAEDVDPPSAWIDGKLRITDVEPILRAAEVLGYVEAAYPGLVRVSPGKHGSQPLITYPRELVTDREAASADRRHAWHSEAGQSALIRHARSAWDLAGAAALQSRIELSSTRRVGANHS